jgi:hypothetical protein
MRYFDKPLVGLIKECGTTLRAKNAHRLIDDGAIAERWTSILCCIESRPAGQQKYIGGMTVVSFRRVAVVQMQKSDLRMSGRKRRVSCSWHRQTAKHPYATKLIRSEVSLLWCTHKNSTKASLFDLSTTTANPCPSENPCIWALHAAVDSKTSPAVGPEKSRWQTSYGTVCCAQQTGMHILVVEALLIVICST